MLVRHALYVAFVVAGVFAAWQARRLWLSPADETRAVQPGDLEEWRYGGETPPRASASVHGGILAQIGAEPLEGDPGGIAPPPGAIRGIGVRRTMGGAPDRDGRRGAAAWVVEQAGYQCPGGVEAAAAHYVERLGERGHRLVADRAAASGRQLLFQAPGGERAYVRLRKLDEQRKMVRVTLSLIRPSD